MEKPLKRRVKMFIVSPNDFIQLFKEGAKFKHDIEILEGVPEDAEIVSLAPDPQRGGVILVVRSEEYDEIPIEQLPPIAHISLQI